MSDALATAHAAGLRAADRCADKAGDPWKEDAIEAIRHHARRGKSFTAEDVRASRPDLAAHDDRAWGSVFQKARRIGYIKPVGAIPVASSRGGFKTLWQAT